MTFCPWCMWCILSTEWFWGFKLQPVTVLVLIYLKSWASTAYFGIYFCDILAIWWNYRSQDFKRHVCVSVSRVFWKLFMILCHEHMQWSRHNRINAWHSPVQWRCETKLQISSFVAFNCSWSEVSGVWDFLWFMMPHCDEKKLVFRAWFISCACSFSSTWLRNICFHDGSRCCLMWYWYLKYIALAENCCFF